MNDEGGKERERGKMVEEVEKWEEGCGEHTHLNQQLAKECGGLQCISNHGNYTVKYTN